MARTLSLFLACMISVSGAFAQSANNAFQECAPVTASNEGLVNPAYIDTTLDDRIATLLNETESVAGLAVAIVHKNKVIYQRGFGYRNLEECLPALPDTRFYLKSTTKSFLGVLAAQLHWEGDIELDAPITEYLPDLSPPGIQASQLTIRQHLTHGIPYFDGGLNYQSAYVGMDESEYIQHINTFARPKDTRFQYSNFGPIVAAHAIGKATGSNWRDLMENKIFAPLTMQNSFTHIDKATNGPIATVYIIGEETRYEPTVLKVDSQMHAAGGAFSTVEDLSRWLVASLNDGLIDGQQALSPFAFQQAHARQINMDWTYYKFRRFAHGFGHYSADYEGDLLMHHFGGETHVSFMPGHDLGIVVLSNQIQGGSITTHRLAALLYDMLLDKDNIEQRWTTAHKEIEEGIERTVNRKKERIAQLRSSAPTSTSNVPAAGVAGKYTNGRLGSIVVSVSGNDILMQFGALSGSLEHIKDNAYLADFDPWGQPPELFVFEMNDTSDKQQINWGGRLFIEE